MTKMVPIKSLIEFCLNEIALEGLDGCPLIGLFDLLAKSALNTCSVQQPIDPEFVTDCIRIKEFFAAAHADIRENPALKINFENYIWKLLSNLIELEFYIIQSNSNINIIDDGENKKPSSSSIVNDSNRRGFCKNYWQRKKFDHRAVASFSDLVKQYGSRFVVVGNQNLRNRSLCPSFKSLNLESLNDFEFCVLEAIGKKRYEGIFTTGADGLTTIFSVSPKQLHYFLINLESHNLIKKQLCSSQNKRLIVHLLNYSQKTKSIVETICDYLATKRAGPHMYCDTLLGLRARFNVGKKKFKSVMQNGERQSMFTRFTETMNVRVRPNQNNNKTEIKSRKIRKVKLTDSYLKEVLNNKNNIAAETTVDDDENVENEDLGSAAATSEEQMELLGAAQSMTNPLYAQMFAKIEQCGKEGISLKRLGTMFGFDFYKSRRICAHLQSHPEIVTLIKETERGKAKYQTVVLRKFLRDSSSFVGNQNNESSGSFLLSTTSTPSKTASAAGAVDIINRSINSSILGSTEATTTDKSTFNNLDQIQIIKRASGDNSSTQIIQALMSNRSLARKQLIIEYINKHRICTKYEISKEIKRVEAEQGLKGAIDSKTTKRMLLAMEAENKLKTFDVNLKNVAYMGVRAIDISETDDEFIKYCSTFRRTFDTVDLKIKQQPADESTAASATETTVDAAEADAEDADADADDDFMSMMSDSSFNAETSHLKLTRALINSIVSKLKFSNNYAKVYSLVPKFQKAIILHRFLQYLLYFYDGKPQDSSNNDGSNQQQIIDRANKIRIGLNEVEREVVDACELPALNRTYYPLGEKAADWRTYVPRLDQARSSSETSILEKNCLFIGEIFSHMPLSIFTSIIVINHDVPGLTALLKHPYKRHMLVKDLPPNLLAPLIYERRYLRRLLVNLQIMACLGLVTFIQSPCKTNQALNRDIQSLMIYVHRSAQFYDTTTNNCESWKDLELNNKLNFESESASSESSSRNQSIPKVNKYDKYVFQFSSDVDVVDYWKKLLHVSQNTYAFNVARYLKESKRFRQKLLKKVQTKLLLSEFEDMKSMLNFSDRMGPGGYDSQLFLNAIKNWLLPSNIISAAQFETQSKSSAAVRKASFLWNANSSNHPAITKEDDFNSVPYSELVMPLGVYRGMASSSTKTTTTAAKRKKSDTTSEQISSSSSGSSKNNSDEEASIDEDVNDDDDDSSLSSGAISPVVKRKKHSGATSATTSRKPKANLAMLRAKSLVDKAKLLKMQPTAAAIENSSGALKLSSINLIERRATWSKEEDELILLIKVAALYFFPDEQSLPFKLIEEISRDLLPTKSADKKTSSFGRRNKVLLNNEMNQLFILNKLELCKQDKELEKKFAKTKQCLKRNIADKEQIELYKEFVVYVRDKYFKRVNYTDGELRMQEEAGEVNYAIADEADEVKKIELPRTMNEFLEKFTIKNSPHRDLMKNNFKEEHFKQPTNDYEISFNTLHSAIHSSILINDKNPRSTESLNLFDKYSDQLLTDVITKMTRQHKIMAPTKYCELKKKNVTAFSKHIGKAYHISQRYQYKWTKCISAANLINDTNKFKSEFVQFEQLKKQQQQKQRLLLNSGNSRTSSKSKQPSSTAQESLVTDMFECSDKDDLGLASFLAHTLDNGCIQTIVNVPDKIFVPKLNHQKF